jgi:hypothetical protein
MGSLLGHARKESLEFIRPREPSIGQNFIEIQLQSVGSVSDGVGVGLVDLVDCQFGGESWQKSLSVVLSEQVVEALEIRVPADDHQLFGTWIRGEDSRGQ